MRHTHAVVVVVVATFAGCSETKPDRLALDPSGPFHFEKRGATEEVRVTAFAGVFPVTGRASCGRCSIGAPSRSLMSRFSIAAAEAPSESSDS